jgi:hypothetical protein
MDWMMRPSVCLTLLAVLMAAPASGALAQAADAPPAPVVAAPLPAAPAPDAAAPPAADASPAPPPSPAIVAAPLQAPDLFSSGAPTGLPADLWRGASADLARQVIPLLSQKALSPAAAAFARRLMSTPGQAPEGAGDDADLAAARIYAVLSLGDAAGAREMLDHTPGVRNSPALSQVAAEADLVLGAEDQACAVGDALTQGKDGPYWRRLRAYCLVRAGDAAGAQLAYDLAEAQAKDLIYKRLMSAALSGTPAGDASLRNGLELALSQRLKLDLTPAIAAAWAPIPPVLAKTVGVPEAVQAAAAARAAQPVNDMAQAGALDPAIRDAALAVAASQLDPVLAGRLVMLGTGGEAAIQKAAALYAALGAPADAKVRSAFAGFDVGRSTASQARLLELEGVSGGGDKGDAALLVLWIAADAGATGPQVADRARLVRALVRVGFSDDARALALEGLLQLTPAPPPPAAAPPPRARVPAKKRK